MKDQLQAKLCRNIQQNTRPAAALPGHTWSAGRAHLLVQLDGERAEGLMHAAAGGEVGSRLRRGQLARRRHVRQHGGAVAQRVLHVSRARRGHACQRDAADGV